MREKKKKSSSLHRNVGRAACMFLMLLTMSAGAGFVQTGRIVEAADAQTSYGKALVEDDADLMSSAEEAFVLQDLQQLADQTGWTCFVLTTDDTGGKSAREYADDYVDANAFEEDGVCYLIDMDNREVYVCTTGEAIRYLTDNRIDEILDQGYYKVSEEEYAECFRTMIQVTANMYDQGIYMDQYNRAERTPGLKPGEILAGFIVAFAAAGIAIFVVVRRYQFKINTYQYDFHKNSQMNLRVQEDRFVNQYVTRRTIPQDTGGHGSTTHSSAGGGTHGGGGRSF